MSPRPGPPEDGRAGAGGRADRDRSSAPERLADLLPATARRLGLEAQLDLSTAVRAWDLIVEEHVPEAVGLCRLTSLELGVAVVAAEQPIVAQELRLRSIELIGALRSAIRAPVRELRIVVRHV